VYAFWLKNEEGQLLDDALTGRGDLTVTPAVLRGTIAVPAEAAVQPSELIIAMGLGDKSLFDRLEECRAEGRNGIPPEELLEYMEDAAEAIDFLNRPVHDLGSGAVAIQHCDIKPHNIMIVGGSVQICDFGLSRVMGSVRATTATAGTIAYAAPECLKEGKPSNSTDQYSLAVSYFELRTGLLPYSSETFAAVTSAVLGGKLDLTRLPPAEREVIRKATSVDPSKRYGSAKEMVQALREALGKGGTPARGMRRHALPLGVAMAVAACLVVAAVGYWRYSRPGVVPAPPQLPLPAPAPPAPLAKAAPITVPEPPEAPGGKPETGSGLPAEQESGEALASRIRALVNEGKFAEAIPAATKAIELRPKDAALYRLRGKAHLGMKQWEEARSDFDAALEAGGNEEDLVGRGQAFLGLDVLDKALADFQAALAKNPHNADAHFYRGVVLTKQQHFDQAIEDFDAARATPAYQSRLEYAEAYLGRGTEYYKHGDFARAIADFETGTRFNPNDFRLFSRLGAAYYLDQQWVKAVDSSGKAIELNPGDLDYINRGRAYQKLKQDDLAVADFRKAAELNPKNAEAHYFLAEEYLFSKKANNKQERDKELRAALEAYSAAIAKYSPDEVSLFDLPHAYFWRGSCERLLGHLDEAAKDFDAALNYPEATNLLAPIDQIAQELAYLARDFAAVRRFPDAARWIKKAADLASDPHKQQYREQLKEYQARTT
jgi:tetratricopeptide (TPR) repeat protein